MTSDPIELKKQKEKEMYLYAKNSGMLFNSEEEVAMELK
jgi:hypothetical protein